MPTKIWTSCLPILSLSFRHTHIHAQSLSLFLFWRVLSGCVMTEILLFGLWGRGKGNNKPYCCFYCQINNIFIRCFSSSQIRERWLIETCRICFQLTQTLSVSSSPPDGCGNVWHCKGLIVWCKTALWSFSCEMVFVALI